MQKLVLGALVLLTSGAIGAASAAPASALSNQNFSVTLTTTDVIAVNRQTGQAVFSAKNFEHDEFLLLRAQSGLSATDTTPFWVGHKITVISLLGPYLGLRDDTDIEEGSGAIPGGGSRYWTIDLRHGETYHLDPNTPLAVLPDGGAITSLATFYSPAQIAAQLAADSFIRKLVPASPGATPTGILDEASSASANACFDIPNDIRTSYVIVAINSSPAPTGQAGIRLGLPGQPSCRTKLTTLGLTFPLSADLRADMSETRLLTPPAGQPPCILEEGQRPESGGSQFSPAPPPLFPSAVSAPTVDRSVLITISPKEKIKLTSVRFRPAPGQSQLFNTYFCGVVIKTAGQPDQGIVVVGIGETETVNCDQLMTAGIMPPLKGEPRIGLIYRTNSPNATGDSPAILLFDAATNAWKIDEPDTVIADNINADLTLANMRSALKN